MMQFIVAEVNSLEVIALTASTFNSPLCAVFALSHQHAGEGAKRSRLSVIGTETLVAFSLRREACGEWAPSGQTKQGNFSQTSAFYLKRLVKSALIGPSGRRGVRWGGQCQPALCSAVALALGRGPGRRCHGCPGGCRQCSGSSAAPWPWGRLPVSLSELEVARTKRAPRLVPEPHCGVPGPCGCHTCPKPTIQGRQHGVPSHPVLLRHGV